MAIDTTLKERGNKYGDYEGGIKLRSVIMEAINNRYYSIHNKRMKHAEQLKIYDIVCKLSRLAVSPDHVDSWHDIQGYARLAEESYTP